MLAGLTEKEIFDLSKIDPWFLRQLRGIVDIELALKAAGKSVSTDLLRQAKEAGFADRQIAHATGLAPASVYSQRNAAGIKTVFRLVDTCAAEFESFTPYFYSTYGDESEVRPSAKKKVMILGGGPNRIGQGIEFDYCCVHASYALRAAGYETVMVNSNPETVSTDYDTSDRLYFEPLTLEDILEIYRTEQCVGANRPVRRPDSAQPRRGPRSRRRHGGRHFARGIALAEDRQQFKDILIRARHPPAGQQDRPLG
jgi:carbamoyl-phosphate synthase large subunit